MMFLSAFITAAAVLSSQALAAPSSDATNVRLQRRATANLFLCANNYDTPNVNSCAWVFPPLDNSCQTFSASALFLNDHISSMTTDYGGNGFTCSFYADYGCKPSVIATFSHNTNGPISTLNALPANANDKISSWRCVPK